MVVLRRLGRRGGPEEVRESRLQSLGNVRLGRSIEAGRSLGLTITSRNAGGVSIVGLGSVLRSLRRILGSLASVLGVGSRLWLRSDGFQRKIEEGCQKTAESSGVLNNRVYRSHLYWMDWGV